MRRRTALVAAVGGLGLVSATAAASPERGAPVGRPTGTIVYVCAEPSPKALSLCSVGADGTGRRLLTPAAGPEAAYASPSLSRDGRRLVFVSARRAYAADARARSPRTLGVEDADAVSLEPSGDRVLVLKRVELCDLPRERCKRTGYTGRIVGWKGGEPRRRPSFLQAADWLTPTRLIGPDAIDPSKLLTLPTSGCCGRLYLHDEAWRLRDPAVSPGGGTIAVSAQEVAGPRTQIALIGRDDRRVRTLGFGAAGTTEDSSPAWSPDGKWLVFMRRRPNGDLPGTLFVVSATPGARPRSLGVRGFTPTWGA